MVACTLELGYVARILSFGVGNSHLVVAVVGGTVEVVGTGQTVVGVSHTVMVAGHTAEDTRLAHMHSGAAIRESSTTMDTTVELH